MPIDNFNLINQNLLIFFSKIAILVILGFYAIFALIIIRQTSLMRKTLMTTTSALVRDLSIYHAIFAFGLIFMVWKIL